MKCRISGVLFVLFMLLCFNTMAGDSIYSINSLSNTLYLGIDNELHIPDSLVYDSSFFFTTDNGIVFRDSTIVNIIPRRLPDAFLNIYKKMDYDTVEIAKFRFFVKYVPKPCIIINSKCIRDIDGLDRYEFINNPKLEIFISDDIVGAQDWIRIKRFSLGYVYGSVYKSYETEGNILSEEMKNVLLRINPGEEISIKVSIESLGNMTKYLPVFKFIVY